MLKSAASLRQVKVLWALGLLPYLIMSTADLDHNDKLAVEKKEKLEWVTPKISLMVAQVTQIKKPIVKKTEAETSIGPS